MIHASSGHQKRVTFAFLMVLFFWFSMYVYVPYTATFLKSQQVSQAWLGLVMGAYGLGQMILRPPLGILSDRKGKPQRFILMGVITPAFASLLRLIFPNAHGFLAGNIFSGIGAAMWICFMIYFAHLFDEHAMQQATAIVMSANMAGQLLGFICSALFYPTLGMRALCLLSILGALAATACFMQLNRNLRTQPPKQTTKPQQDHDLPSLRQALELFKNKRLLFFSLFGFMQTGVGLATVSNFDTQKIILFGGKPTLVGLLTIVFILVQLLFSSLSATRWFSQKRAVFWLPICFVSLSAYCFLSPQTKQIWQLFALQILSGFFAGVVTSFAVTEATKGIPKKLHTTAMGIYQCFVAIGITLLPMLTGYLADRYHTFNLAYFVLGYMSLICLVLALWGTRTQKLCPTKA